MAAVTYILPVHNEAEHLEGQVDRLLAYFRQANSPIEVVLAENGSRDRSAELARELANRHGDTRIHAVTTPDAGLGHALDLGLKLAFTLRAPSPDHFYLLTAADLPFGFSDFEQFERWRQTNPTGRIAIGSKAHPDSQVETTPMRAAMSELYRLARGALLQMHVGDSQGSIFIQDELARRVLPQVVSRDFFFSTELVYYAGRAGAPAHELPVVLEKELRTSTVKPFRAGFRMLRQLTELRGRARREMRVNE